MAVLSRIKAVGQRGKTFLLLSDTHLIFEADPSFRSELTEGVKRGHVAGGAVTGKALAEATDVAMHLVEKALAPHQLSDVEFVSEPGRLTIRLKDLNFALRNLAVEPKQMEQFLAQVH